MTVRGIQWDAQPLGQVSDREIAASLGCSINAVGCARKKRDIFSPVPATRQTTTACIRPRPDLIHAMSTLALEVVAGWRHEGCRCPAELFEAELKRRREEGSIA